MCLDLWESQWLPAARPIDWSEGVFRQHLGTAVGPGCCALVYTHRRVRGGAVQSALLSRVPIRCSTLVHSRFAFGAS